MLLEQVETAAADSETELSEPLAAGFTLKKVVGCEKLRGTPITGSALWELRGPGAILFTLCQMSAHSSPGERKRWRVISTTAGVNPQAQSTSPDELYGVLARTRGELIQTIIDFCHRNGWVQR